MDRPDRVRSVEVAASYPVVSGVCAMNGSVDDAARPIADGARIPLASGARIDHYVIDTVLGAGGFGITYLANHDRLGKPFAIKEYFPADFSFRQGASVRPTGSTGATFQWGLDRFLAEARALAQLKHPSIVDVVSIFETNHTAYMVCAYEEGTSFRDWLASLGRPPSQPEIDNVLMPLLSAIEAVHANNLMHRDIAPDNILIRKNGSPVLIDFGSARESTKGLARGHSVIVKKGYSPPEQYSTDPGTQGPWTDIYALSATLFRAVTGKMPQDAAERLLADTLVPVWSLVTTNYRSGFLFAIDHGLKLRPAERPLKVSDWREALFRRDAKDTWTQSSRSGRPDLSELDAQPASTQIDVPPVAGQSAELQRIYAAAAGCLVGGGGGVLTSITLASITSPNCVADLCLVRHSLSFAIVGSLIGLLVGLYLTRSSGNTD